MPASIAMDPYGQAISYRLHALVAGVDEAGRGPLAGPVIAAAVVLNQSAEFKGLNDSKLLSARKRETLSKSIQESCQWAIGRAEHNEIDELNILQASLRAMQRAVQALTEAPETVLVDGPVCPILDCRSIAIVKGDQRIPCISAASIVAKVARDREMLVLSERYPAYGFERNKGYPTREHLRALDKHGPSPVHRMSYAPVRRAQAIWCG